jgi:serine/threonine protein kinase
VARLLDADGSDPTVTLIGTPEFVAPEQATEGVLTPQTDIYQLGVTVFQMMTGQRPFSGSSIQIILQHLHEPLPSAEALNPELPPGFDAVLKKATAKNAQDRYSSAGALVEALAILHDDLTKTRLFALPLHAARRDLQVTQEAVATAFIPSAKSEGRSWLTRRAIVFALVGTLAIVMALLSLVYLPTLDLLTGMFLQDSTPAQPAIVIDDDDQNDTVVNDSGTFTESEDNVDVNSAAGNDEVEASNADSTTNNEVASGAALGNNAETGTDDIVGQSAATDDEADEPPGDEPPPANNTNPPPPPNDGQGGGRQGGGPGGRPPDDGQGGGGDGRDGGRDGGPGKPPPPGD